jgi:alpha-beta hydrolase superfamily lysophospholipase
VKISTVTAPDGVVLFVYSWLPKEIPRAAVQIVHGMAEHAGRYDEVARALNTAGYAVYAHDQRGHGQTALTPQDLGSFDRPGIWRAFLDDLALVQHRVAKDFPGSPQFLLGHSMGSFLAQHFAAENDGAYAGLILSGTYLEPRVRARAGALAARLERLRLGPRGRSQLIRALTFDAYARQFTPARTNFDWLSRDPAEVDKYAADSRCGFDLSVQLWIELLDTLASGLPLPASGLPVCLLIGERDPVCAPDFGATRLVDKFHRAGIHRVAQCVYPEGRHELFHETNRGEVAADLLSWLDQFAPHHPPG